MSCFENRWYKRLPKLFIDVFHGVNAEGVYDNGDSERFDVEAAIEFAFNNCSSDNLWVMGWSFGTELALKWAKDLRIAGLILLSPPMKYTTQSDLDFWRKDGRAITALIPEFDEYLNPEAARSTFTNMPNLNLIEVTEGKHLWVGEPQVHRVLTEITKVVAPTKLPLATEI